MILKLLRHIAGIGCLFFLSINLNGQFCIPLNLGGTVVNLACNQVCSNLNFQIPHIKGTGEYTVTPTLYAPFPYVTGAPGLLLPCSDQDDKYFDEIPIPFDFCFFGSIYNKLVVSTNGAITFDVSNALRGSNWNLNTGIQLPFEGTGTQGIAGTCPNPNGVRLPKAAIFGAFCDIFPQISDPLYEIEARVEGLAPCRQFVISFSKVPMFGCADVKMTSQIVLHETTGIIDVFIENKPLCNSNNGGLAIIGIQNELLGTVNEKGVTAPGRGARNGPWSATNEGWRFIPSGAGSRYVRSELYTLAVLLVATADTTTTIAGILDLSFPNVCPPAGSTQYEVRTTFSSCSDPLILFTPSNTITVNRTNNLNATAIATNTACGTPSGSITVNVPAGAGIAPYTFVLDPGPGQITQTGASPMLLNNIAAGPHTLIVTDASGGCTSAINLTVNQTNNLTLTATTVATTCPGINNGSISVAPANGIAPYTFILNPGNIIQTGAMAFYTGLAMGSYTIAITDAGGCTTNPVATINVTSGPSLNTTAAKTDVLCFGGNTATITVAQPASGTAPYQYSLNNIIWQASNVFTGLIANTYTVYFRESNGCQGTLITTVVEPTVLAAAASTVPVVCNSQNNGIITATPTGGISPYQYSINAGANWQSSNIFNVSANTYTVTIRDNNNCIATQTVTVTQPPVLTATATTTNASCNGGSDGIITVTALGGTTSYEYSIDAGASWQSSNIFNVVSGYYTPIVRDNMGCTYQFSSTAGLTNDLVFIPQIDPAICESKSTQLQLVSNAIQYSWTPATGLSNAAIPNPVANPVVTTQYTVTATLGSCSINDNVIVNVNAAPIPDAGQNAFICYGQTYTLQGSGGLQYTWAPSAYLNTTSGVNPVTNPAKTITYTLVKVIDEKGCESLTTDDIIVDVTPPIKVTTFPYDTIGYPGDQFELQAIAAVPAANIFCGRLLPV